jgi:hypothetical protein
MFAWLLAVVLAPGLAQGQPAGKPLQIADNGVRQMEDGPPIAAGAAFVPGETVFFSFQVHGYGTSAGKVQLSYRIEVLDPDGIPVVEPKEGKVATTLTTQDKDWIPRVRHEFVLPTHALGGRFRVTAVVKDAITSQQTRAETALPVASRALDVTGPLAVRGPQFFKGEDDRNPLSDPVYRGGESLRARFDVVGFARGEKNRIRVSYGVAVEAASGKVLFSEPEAAVEEDTPFYPKRYVPGEAGLTVRPGTAPGVYTLIITARDEVGGGTAEARAPFRVE